MSEPLNLAVIYGSARKNRFCEKVAAWALAEVERHGGFNIQIVDPRHLTAPVERRLDEAIAGLRAQLDWADAFLVITPEYNHGYTGALKVLIDAAYVEWQAKPVGFVSYGGLSGGLRAVEQLRLVFAELHGVGLRDTVSFSNAWDQFCAEGSLIDPRAAVAAMASLLSALVWWGTALRSARLLIPYGKVAA